jgi:carbon storage regulator
MLVLTRRVGQVVVIGGGISVKVLAVHHNRMRIGIVAPSHVIVERSEVHERHTAFESMDVRSKEETGHEVAPDRPPAGPSGR